MQIKQYRLPKKTYDLSTHKGLPVGQELFLGGSDICNRYLRREDGIIEVQRIVRWGNNGETRLLTEQEFDEWREKIRNINEVI